jgi:hypothetical protein
MLSDGTDVEDVLQSVWLRVVRSLVQLREPERLAAWLYGIARRTVVDRLREYYRRRPHDELGEISDVDEGFEMIAVVDAVQAGLQRLHPASKEFSSSTESNPNKTPPENSYPQLLAISLMISSPVGPDHLWKRPSHIQNCLRRIAKQHPNLLKDMEQVFDQVGARTVHVDVPHPVTGESLSVGVNAFDLQVFT